MAGRVEVEVEVGVGEARVEEARERAAGVWRGAVWRAVHPRAPCLVPLPPTRGTNMWTRTWSVTMIQRKWTASDGGRLADVFVSPTLPPLLFVLIP